MQTAMYCWAMLGTSFLVVSRHKPVLAQERLVFAQVLTSSPTTGFFNPCLGGKCGGVSNTFSGSIPPRPVSIHGFFRAFCELVSEFLPVPCRKPLFGYTRRWCTPFLGLFSSADSVWAHHNVHHAVRPPGCACFSRLPHGLRSPYRTGNQILFNWLAPHFGRQNRTEQRHVLFRPCALHRSLSFSVASPGWALGQVPSDIHVHAPLNFVCRAFFTTSSMADRLRRVWIDFNYGFPVFHRAGC